MKKLFINGKIWTGKFEFAESFGINDDKFDHVDTNDLKLHSQYDEVTDLEGRLVLPGLIDGHLHLVYGSVMKTRLDCTGIDNEEVLKEKIKNYIDNNQDKDFIIGGNLNSSQIKISNGFIDNIESAKPVFITNYDYHSGFCNVKAMESTGLLKAADEFDEKYIPKDSSGKYTGIVKESAMNFMFANLPQESDDDKVKAVCTFIKVMHSYGITGVSDIILRENISIYEKLLRKGIDLRIGAYLPIEFLNEYEEYISQTINYDKERFEIKGLKGFYDGALGSETGLFKEKYRGKDNYGIRTEMAESGELKRSALEADRRKIQVIIHAIGDKAVSEVIDIAAEMFKSNGDYDRRFRIEHAQHIDERDLEKFSRYKIIASVQPIHLKYDAGLVLRKLNEETASRTHNYNKLLDLNGKLNFGTDFPIAGINPFENIQTALLRKYDGEKTFYPENRISLHDSIEAYTINNAYANFTDNLTGSIKAGKKADFVIMDDDLFEMDPEMLHNAQVHETYFNGKKVYPCIC
jgi:predicted amidohydrolase YtcJ